MTMENWMLALATMLTDAANDITPNLSESGAALLLTLDQRGSMSVTNAAAVLDVSQPTLSRLADRLDRLGLAERLAKTGRDVPLRATAAGAKTAKSLIDGRMSVARTLLSSLTESEREVFGICLRKMLAAGTSSRAMARTTCRFCDHGVCSGSGCPVGSRANELEGMAEAPP